MDVLSDEASFTRRVAVVGDHGGRGRVGVVGVGAVEGWQSSEQRRHTADTQVAKQYWGCDVESWGVDPEGVGGVPNSVVRGIGLAGLFIPMTTTVVALTLLPVGLSKLAPKMDWPRGESARRTSREIAVHMHRLRRKVDPASGMPVILTLRGEGYLIRNDTP